MCSTSCFLSWCIFVEWLQRLIQAWHTYDSMLGCFLQYRVNENICKNTVMVTNIFLETNFIKYFGHRVCSYDFKSLSCTHHPLSPHGPRPDLLKSSAVAPETFSSRGKKSDMWSEFSLWLPTCLSYQLLGWVPAASCVDFSVIAISICHMKGAKTGVPKISKKGRLCWDVGRISNQDTGFD